MSALELACKNLEHQKETVDLGMKDRQQKRHIARAWKTGKKTMNVMSALSHDIIVMKAPTNNCDHPHAFVVSVASARAHTKAIIHSLDMINHESLMLQSDINQSVYELREVDLNFAKIKLESFRKSKQDCENEIEKKLKSNVRKRSLQLTNLFQRMLLHTSATIDSLTVALECIDDELKSKEKQFNPSEKVMMMERDVVEMDRRQMTKTIEISRTILRVIGLAISQVGSGMTGDIDTLTIKDIHQLDIQVAAERALLQENAKKLLERIETVETPSLQSSTKSFKTAETEKIQVDAGLWTDNKNGAISMKTDHDHEQHVHRRISELEHYHGGLDNLDKMPTNEEENAQSKVKLSNARLARKKIHRMSLVDHRGDDETNSNFVSSSSPKKDAISSSSSVSVGESKSDSDVTDEMIKDAEKESKLVEENPLASIFEIGHASATAHALGCRGQLYKLASAWTNGYEVSPYSKHARNHILAVLHALHIIDVSRKRRDAGLSELRGEANAILVAGNEAENEINTIGDVSQDGLLIALRGEDDKDANINQHSGKKKYENLPGKGTGSNLVSTLVSEENEESISKTKIVQKINLYLRHFQSSIGSKKSAIGKNVRLLNDQEAKTLQESFAAVAAHARAIIMCLDKIDELCNNAFSEELDSTLLDRESNARELKTALVHCQAHGAGMMHALRLVAMERNLQNKQDEMLLSANGGISINLFTEKEAKRCKKHLDVVESTLKSLIYSSSLLTLQLRQTFRWNTAMGLIASICELGFQSLRDIRSIELKMNSISAIEDEINKQKPKKIRRKNEKLLVLESDLSGILPSSLKYVVTASEKSEFLRENVEAVCMWFDEIKATDGMNSIDSHLRNSAQVSGQAMRANVSSITKHFNDLKLLFVQQIRDHAKRRKRRAERREMLEREQKKQVTYSEQILAEAKVLFCEYDEDGNMELDADEMIPLSEWVMEQLHMNYLEKKTENSENNFENSEFLAKEEDRNRKIMSEMKMKMAEELTKSMDHNNDGRITFPEFVLWYEKVKDAIDNIEMIQLQRRQEYREKMDKEKNEMPYRTMIETCRSEANLIARRIHENKSNVQSAVALLSHVISIDATPLTDEYYLDKLHVEGFAVSKHSNLKHEKKKQIYLNLPKVKASDIEEGKYRYGNEVYCGSWYLQKETGFQDFSKLMFLYNDSSASMRLKSLLTAQELYIAFVPKYVDPSLFRHQIMKFQKKKLLEEDEKMYEIVSNQISKKKISSTKLKMANYLADGRSAYNVECILHRNRSTGILNKEKKVGSFTTIDSKAYWLQDETSIKGIHFDALRVDKTFHFAAGKQIGPKLKIECTYRLIRNEAYQQFLNETSVDEKIEIRDNIIGKLSDSKSGLLLEEIIVIPSQCLNFPPNEYDKTGRKVPVSFDLIRRMYRRSPLAEVEERGGGLNFQHLTLRFPTKMNNNILLSNVGKGVEESYKPDCGTHLHHSSSLCITPFGSLKAAPKGGLVCTPNIMLRPVFVALSKLCKLIEQCINYDNGNDDLKRYEYEGKESIGELYSQIEDILHQLKDYSKDTKHPILHAMLWVEGCHLLLCDLIRSNGKFLQLSTEIIGNLLSQASTQLHHAMSTDADNAGVCASAVITLAASLAPPYSSEKPLQSYDRSHFIDLKNGNVQKNTENINDFGLHIVKSNIGTLVDAFHCSGGNPAVAVLALQTLCRFRNEINPWEMRGTSNVSIVESAVIASFNFSLVPEIQLAVCAIVGRTVAKDLYNIKTYIIGACPWAFEDKNVKRRIGRLSLNASRWDQQAEEFSSTTTSSTEIKKMKNVSVSQIVSVCGYMASLELAVGYNPGAEFQDCVDRPRYVNVLLHQARQAGGCAIAAAEEDMYGVVDTIEKEVKAGRLELMGHGALVALQTSIKYLNFVAEQSIENAIIIEKLGGVDLCMRTLRTRNWPRAKINYNIIQLLYEAAQDLLLTISTQKSKEDSSLSTKDDDEIAQKMKRVQTRYVNQYIYKNPFHLSEEQKYENYKRQCKRRQSEMTERLREGWEIVSNVNSTSQSIESINDKVRKINDFTSGYNASLSHLSNSNDDKFASISNVRDRQKALREVEGARRKEEAKRREHEQQLKERHMQMVRMQMSLLQDSEYEILFRIFLHYSSLYSQRFFHKKMVEKEEKMKEEKLEKERIKAIRKMEENRLHALKERSKAGYTTFYDQSMEIKRREEDLKTHGGSRRVDKNVKENDKIHALVSNDSTDGRYGIVEKAKQSLKDIKTNSDNLLKLTSIKRLENVLHQMNPCSITKAAFRLFLTDIGLFSNEENAPNPISPSKAASRAALTRFHQKDEKHPSSLHLKSSKKVKQISEDEFSFIFRYGMKMGFKMGSLVTKHNNDEALRHRMLCRAAAIELEQQEKDEISLKTNKETVNELEKERKDLAQKRKHRMRHGKKHVYSNEKKRYVPPDVSMILSYEQLNFSAFVAAMNCIVYLQSQSNFKNNFFHKLEKKRMQRKVKNEERKVRKKSLDVLAKEFEMKTSATLKQAGVSKFPEDTAENDVLLNALREDDITSPPIAVEYLRKYILPLSSGAHRTAVTSSKMEKFRSTNVNGINATESQLFLQSASFKECFQKFDLNVVKPLFNVYSEKNLSGLTFYDCVILANDLQWSSFISLTDLSLIFIASLCENETMKSFLNSSAVKESSNHSNVEEDDEFEDDEFKEEKSVGAGAWQPSLSVNRFRVFLVRCGIQWYEARYKGRWETKEKNGMMTAEDHYNGTKLFLQRMKEIMRSGEMVERMKRRLTDPKIYL
eukprot:g5924.t1